MQGTGPQVTDWRQPVTTLLLLAAMAILLAVLTGLSTGEFYSNYDGGEVFRRHTDMQNYARHRLAGNAEYLHPLYADLVLTNPSLGPKVIAWLAKLSGSLWAANTVVSALYIAAYGFALPMLAYALFGRVLLSLVLSAAMFALAHNAHVYGYFQMALTGVATTSLFVIALSALVAKRPILSAGVIGLQLLVHPVTAVFWGPLWLFLALCLCGGGEAKSRVGTWLAAASAFLADRRGPKLLAAVPVLAGAAMVGIESLGVFNTPDAASYWQIIEVRASHTLFLGWEKYHLPVGYLGLTIGVLLCGLAHRGNAALGLISRASGYFGLGIFVVYAALVETHISPLVAATLPLRFEAVLYVLLILNLVDTVMGGRTEKPEARAVGALYLATFFAWHYAAPLYVAWIWAVLQRGIEGSLAWRRAVWVTCIGTLVQLSALLYLPSGGKWRQSSTNLDFMASFGWLRRALIEVFDVAQLNAYRGLEFLSYAALLVAAAVCVKAARKYGGRPVCAGLALVAVLALAHAGMRGAWVRLKPHKVGQELAAIVSGKAEATQEKQVANWLIANVPAGTRILAAPDRYWRRLTPHHYSLDGDILSFVPYKPKWSKRVAQELANDYGLDIAHLAKSKIRLSQALNNDMWTQIKLKAVARQREKGNSFRYIVEKTSMPDIGLPVVFKTDRYRVSRID